MADAKLNFNDAFCGASEIHTFLAKDTLLALKNFRDATADFNNDKITDGAEIAFLAKATIRAFLGHVDGIGYALRRTAVAHANDSTMPLTLKQRAELLELKYDSRAGSVSDEGRSVSTEKSIKAGIKYFARLFKSDFVLDTSGDEWRGFKRLVVIRNRFTHPKLLEDLTPRFAMNAIAPTIFWFIGQMRDMLADISVRQGLPQALGAEPSGPSEYKESQNKLEYIFSAEDYEAIKAVARRSLEYVKIMFTISAADTTRALDLIKKNGDSSYSHAHQYSVRNAIRTLFADVEATIGGSRFFIDAAMKRGEISLSENDVSVMRRGEVEDRLIAILGIWSREFGYGGILQAAGDGWKQFRGARFFRDRLSHPKDVRGLRVNAAEKQRFLAAAKFFSDSRSALRIDPDRWASLVTRTDGEASSSRAEPESDGDDEN